ncbi:MAG: hypothetical protein Q9N34_00700 [Aquificota bacterium]|nr:hypothetical protein [Aquificota bacterium]
MNRIFDGTTLRGTPGLYPLTAENLFRVGLALSLLLQTDRCIEKPVLSLDHPDFVTLSIAVGFMNGGGTVRVDGSGDLEIVCRRGKWVVSIGGLSEADIRKLEIILFGRTPMPRRTGSAIGRVEPWTQSGRP